MTDRLFPMARLITPNIPETESLTGLSINNETDMEQAARLIYEKYARWLISDQNSTPYTHKSLVHDYTLP